MIKQGMSLGDGGRWRRPARVFRATLLGLGCVLAPQGPVLAEAPSGAVVASADPGPTVAAIKARGLMKCGVNTGLPGLSAVDTQGNWVGFDVDFCRAVAAAVLGDSTQVEYVPLSAAVRLSALAEGAIDVLARNTTWTLGRDAGMGLSFVGTNLYDGQGLLVWNGTPGESAKDLPEGTRVCFQINTTTARNLMDVIKARNLPLEPVPHVSLEDARAGFFLKDCQAYTGDRTGIASIARTEAPRPGEMRVLPDVFSKEPLGPAVREGDSRWFDIVRWTLFALIQAEEYGVTSVNLEQVATGAGNPALRRFLGVEPGVGAPLGLDDQWVWRVVAQVGNYGEIFERNLGKTGGLDLERGLNDQWTRGGLLYAPPFP
jgi:general L-amino acid transport system substrate-binding protein